MHESLKCFLKSFYHRLHIAPCDANLLEFVSFNALLILNRPNITLSLENL